MLAIFDWWCFMYKQDGYGRFQIPNLKMDPDLQVLK